MGLIPEYIVKEIEQKASVLEVVNQFIPLSGSGASRSGVCPKCTGKKKFSVSPSKNVWGCFACDIKGKGAISFLMNMQGKTYPEALHWLADYYHVLIPEEVIEQKKKKPKKGSEIAPLEPIPHTAQRRVEKSPVQSFRDQQLAASGIADEDQKFEVVTDENTKTLIDRYIPATLNERYEVVPGDDMAMRYVGLDGKLMDFMPKNGKGKREFYRMRWQLPDVHTDKNGNPMKYQSPAGAGSRLWFPSKFISLYQSGRAFETLFIHEGEKKADKAMKHGMDSLGIQGIHNLAENDRLPHDVEMIVKRGTKNVVFVVDGDFRDLGRNREKAADARPRSFMRAVENFQKHFFAFNNMGIYLNIYFAYVRKNEANEKGIDDVLAGSMKGKEDQLVQNVFHTMNIASGEGQYLDVHNITTWTGGKLMQFFNLHNVQAFAKAYKHVLAEGKVFKFGRELWRYKEDSDEVELAQPLSENEKFWDTRTINRREGGTEDLLRFNYNRCYLFLKKRGYYRFRSQEGRKFLVHVDQNVVEEVERDDVKTYVTSFCEQMSNEALLNLLYGNGQRYFSDDSLSNLKFIEPRFHESQKGVQYMFFSNCYWKITEHGITDGPMADMDGYVWKSQIADQVVQKIEPMMNVAYHPTPEQLAEKAAAEKAGQPYEFDYSKGDFEIVGQSEEGERCHFMNFLFNCSNFFKGTPTESFTHAQRQECVRHFLQKCTAFGYMLHTYHDPRMTKALIAMDAKLSEVGNSEGRSGKSLLGKALEHLVPTVYIGGKAKDITEDRFLLEEVKPGVTKVLWIDDVRVNFDFEFFFPFITGGAKFETKGIRRTTLSIEQTPKLYVCTNHAINEAGGSFSSRMIKLAFSDWYFDNGQGVKHTPIDDFGVSFFDEWDAEQWNLFYNFAAVCLQLYFRFGVIYAPNDRLELRRLRQFMGEIFLDWADSYFEKVDNRNHEIPRDEITKAFHDAHPDQKKHTDVRRVKQKLVAWCKYRHRVFNPGHPHVKDGTPYGGDIKKGGVEYFIIADENYQSGKAINTTQTQIFT